MHVLSASLDAIIQAEFKRLLEDGPDCKMSNKGTITLLLQHEESHLQQSKIESHGQLLKEMMDQRIKVWRQTAKAKVCHCI
eukprot:scaffold191_cov273-Chaetoceros_neogracile.AAC.23